MDLLGLSVRWPIVGAPMAGGPSTPALVAAVSGAGGLGLLAGGYLDADSLALHIAGVRRSGVAAFGVNLFVPSPRAVDEAALRTYLDSVRPEAEASGVDLVPSWDDDHFSEKAELLTRHPVPVVTFTFGTPPPDLVTALHGAGSRVVVTVTTPGEAVLATSCGADALCAEGIEAGGHQGSFGDDVAPDTGWGLLALVSAIRTKVSTPVIAAGGIMTGTAVAAVVRAGAVAAQVGTALLRCPESGAPAVHKDALGDPAFTGTAITRAFSGRRARGLVNGFMRAHPDAPSAYPHINNATRALRRAAVMRGDPHGTNLWAGQGFASARALPAHEVVTTMGQAFESLGA